MWFDPGLAGLFINLTLLHLGEDINLLVVSHGKQGNFKKDCPKRTEYVQDRDDRHRATSSQSLWIDLPSHCNQRLVGIMVDFEVKGGEDPR